MNKLEVFDPPMCCSSGVCGPRVDPVLPRFAADIAWLKERGVEVHRYNLSQQPHAFAANPEVARALEKGTEVLPIIAIDGRIVSTGGYPSRADLALHLGIAADIPVLAVNGKGSGGCAPGSGCC